MFISLWNKFMEEPTDSLSPIYKIYHMPFSIPKNI